MNGIKVGLVKLGKGTLEFGSAGAATFSGPATIYEGTLKVAKPASLSNRAAACLWNGC